MAKQQQKVGGGGNRKKYRNRVARSMSGASLYVVKGGETRMLKRKAQRHGCGSWMKHRDEHRKRRTG